MIRYRLTWLLVVAMNFKSGHFVLTSAVAADRQEFPLIQILKENGGLPLNNTGSIMFT